MRPKNRNRYLAGLSLSDALTRSDLLTLASTRTFGLIGRTDGTPVSIVRYDSDGDTIAEYPLTPDGFPFFVGFLIDAGLEDYPESDG